MDDVDIALFDYDRYNTLYYFLMNADEQIYMRSLLSKLAERSREGC